MQNIKAKLALSKTLQLAFELLRSVAIIIALLALYKGTGFHDWWISLVTKIF